MTRRLAIMVTMLIPAGCGKSPTPLPEPDAAPPVVVSLPGVDYRAEQSGSLSGRVLWSGPATPRGESTGAVPKGEGYSVKTFPDAFAIPVDPTTRGLAGVLVIVQVAEPKRWKAWPYAAARIVARDFRWTAYQGDAETAGPLIVRRGDALTMTSQDDELHVFRGRGAAFFSLAFPKPTTRTIELVRSGIVEIASGAGYHWLAHDVAVGEHPYLAVTDANGVFTIDGLPNGEYEVSFRLRNPTILNRERDPETGLFFRTNYATAKVKTKTAKIEIGRVAQASVEFDTNDLKPSEAKR